MRTLKTEIKKRAKDKNFRKAFNAESARLKKSSKRVKRVKGLKLKKGDMVWVRVPVNAIITSVNQRYGYTIYVLNNEAMSYSYFDDSEVLKVKRK